MQSQYLAWLVQQEVRILGYPWSEGDLRAIDGMSGWMAGGGDTDD